MIYKTQKVISCSGLTIYSSIEIIFNSLYINYDNLSITLSLSRKGIQESLVTTKTNLARLQEDIGKTLEKIGSRYIYWT